MAVYVLLIRPLFLGPAVPATASIATQHQQRQHQQASETSKLLAITKAATRVPCHLSMASSRMVTSGGSNVLADGLVAFRHTHAACFPSGELLTSGRAKILAKLLSYMDSETKKPILTSPPVKGSLVVIAIPFNHVTCDKLRTVLHILGIYYNIILIVGVSEETHRATLISQLRDAPLGGELPLPTEIIPDHRIILAQTAAGRIAVTRQLERVELVLDYDPDVVAQLRRFKHKVIACGVDTSSSRTLGHELLPSLFTCTMEG